MGYLATGRTSSYIYDPKDIGAPAVTGSADGATVLSEMKDATFILGGVFTPEGSGLAVAFTRGPQGWGRVVRTGDTRLEVSTLAPLGLPVLKPLSKPWLFRTAICKSTRAPTKLPSPTAANPAP